MIDNLADGTWDHEFDDPFLRIGHRFGRTDLRRRMRDHVRALLGPVGRKTAGNWPSTQATAPPTACNGY